VKYILPLLALSAAPLLLAGCSQPDPMSFEALSADITPELATLTQRQLDIDRTWALSYNENLRMANEDMVRIWFGDEPSPLSPYPTINTGGAP